MARSGVYKSEVKRARDSLLAQGKHPSLDSIRIALGNTGSKSTIHKFLKELEAEEGEPVGQRVGLSDALTDLVQRLAGQLQEEANRVVSEAETRFKREQTEMATATAAQREESNRFSETLRRTEVLLSEARAAHEATRGAHNELRASSAAQAARIDGLTTQLDERNQRIASLEQKHVHAREALEHFRTAAKEQREQELRRHDQALQSVQLELRQAGDALIGKNHELQQLNRDNGRLLEQNMAKDRELGAVRSELRAAHDHASALDAELSTLRQAALTHAATATQRDQLTELLSRSEQSLCIEMDEHRRVIAERDRLQGRIGALEELVRRPEHRTDDARAGDGLEPSCA